jgi:CRISPR-associated protein Cmr3
MSAADWTGFRLLPDDVLFFRDGRPSTRGEDHYLRSLFPPNPSTLYGALRTRRLADENVSLQRLRRQGKSLWNALPADLRAELGEWRGFGSLEVRGPWLVRGTEEVLLPAPGDLAVVPRPSEEHAAPPDPDPDLDREPRPPAAERVARFLATDADPRRGGHSHAGALLRPYEWKNGTWQRWSGSTPPRSAAGWFLTSDGYAAWARGAAPDPGQLVHADRLWVSEPRVGVGLESGRRMAEDGQLYTFGFVRLRQDVYLGFEARGTALAPGCRVVLGGEGRTCWLDRGPVLPQAPVPGAGGGAGLRLATATPTLAQHGSALPGFTALGEAGALTGRRLRLAGACVPGHTLVGGWDLARGGPKPLRRAIPAGSTFLLQPEEAGGELPDPADLHGTNLADFPGEHLARQGFGLLLAGLEPRLPNS